MDTVQQLINNLRQSIDASALTLYQREHILLKLAYAAKHKNLLALYHLISAFKLYEGDIQDKKNKLKIMSKTLKNKLNDSLKDNVLPSFSLGRLYQFMYNEEKALECYEKIQNMSNRAKWILAGYKDEKEQKNEYKKLIDKYPYALVNLARLHKNPEKAYKLYIKAGDCGIGEGYYNAALMVVNGYMEIDSKEVSDVNDKVIELFTKAGDLGMLNGYHEAATILISMNDIDKAEALYKLQIKKGDYNGSIYLSELYKNIGKDKEEKEIIFDMKGPISFFYQSKSNINVMYENYFKDLYNIVM